MFGRIFLILVLLAVSLYVVKYLRAKMDAPQKRIKKGKNTKNKMVKCLHCGLHIPEQEAIRQGDKVFCSLEHAKREI